MHGTLLSDHPAIHREWITKRKKKWKSHHRNGARFSKTFCIAMRDTQCSCSKQFSDSMVALTKCNLLTNIFISNSSSFHWTLAYQKRARTQTTLKLFIQSHIHSVSHAYKNNTNKSHNRSDAAATTHKNNIKITKEVLFIVVINHLSISFGCLWLAEREREKNH